MCIFLHVGFDFGFTRKWLSFWPFDFLPRCSMEYELFACNVHFCQWCSLLLNYLVDIRMHGIFGTSAKVYQAHQRLLELFFFMVRVYAFLLLIQLTNVEDSLRIRSHEVLSAPICRYAMTVASITPIRSEHSLFI